MGIVLNESKRALVSARVRKRMRELGIDHYREYYNYLNNDHSGNELVQLLDVISTNVTHFFRESEHFDILAHLSAKWLNRGQKKFRFWSAACSTGQEPYAMAMSLSELNGMQSADLKILATDISTRVLAYSRKGIYTSRHLDTVPKKMKGKYFHSNGHDNYAINDALKEQVIFKRLNLAQPPFPMKGPLDVVFCCNVMIYFDNIIRTALVEEIYRLLKPGGYLIIGNAESLSGIQTALTTVKPSVYRKPK